MFRSVRSGFLFSDGWGPETVCCRYLGRAKRLSNFKANFEGSFKDSDFEFLVNGHNVKLSLFLLG